MLHKQQSTWINNSLAMILKVNSYIGLNRRGVTHPAVAVYANGIAVN
jgi:hypothetical protein